MKTLALLLILFAMPSFAANNSNGKQPCATAYYSIVQKDKLGNVDQIVSAKLSKRLNGDLYKKYPDVCYAAPGASVHTMLLITVEPATYHGTRIVTTTQNENGNISGSGGDSATYRGTTESSTAVPYSFEYGRYMLTVETEVDQKFTVRRRFQQDGIYRTMYGIPLGGRGHHPAQALIEDAVKWIHGGGLNDPLQSAQ